MSHSKKVLRLISEKDENDCGLHVVSKPGEISLPLKTCTINQGLTVETRVVKCIPPSNVKWQLWTFFFKPVSGLSDLTLVLLEVADPLSKMPVTVKKYVENIKTSSNEIPPRMKKWKISLRFPSRFSAQELLVARLPSGIKE